MCTEVQHVHSVHSVHIFCIIDGNTSTLVSWCLKCAQCAQRCTVCTMWAYYIYNEMCLCTLVNTKHCQQVVFASVHIKIWSVRESGPPVCMCQSGIMEGAMNYWTSPRVYHSYETTWAQYTGPNKQFLKCSIFHLWHKVLSCTGHSTCWVYPICL